MQIHVVDSIFGLLEVRFVTIFFLFWGGPGVAFFGVWILYGAHPRPQGIEDYD